jgi:hypothetical protein
MNAHCMIHSSFVSTCPGCVARKKSVDEQNHAADLRRQNDDLRRRRDELEIANSSATTLTMIESILTASIPSMDVSTSTPDVLGGSGTFDGGGASGAW